jgi:predicted RNase H-like nuclease (RuvC/YqgF family)
LKSAKPESSQIDQTARLRMETELEQATVAIEDLDARLAQFAEKNERLTTEVAELERRNGILSERLILETARREEAEARVRRDRDDADLRTEVAALKHELSVVLEELQVMQEELEYAHRALVAGGGGS